MISNLHVWVSDTEKIVCLSLRSTKIEPQVSGSLPTLPFGVRLEYFDRCILLHTLWHYKKILLTMIIAPKLTQTFQHVTRNVLTFSSFWTFHSKWYSSEACSDPGLFVLHGNLLPVKYGTLSSRLKLGKSYLFFLFSEDFSLHTMGHSLTVPLHSEYWCPKRILSSY